MDKQYFFLYFILCFFFLNAQENIRDTVLYYSSGVISSKGSFMNGKPYGKWINYYENGKIRSEGNFVDGLLDGNWMFYDTTGIVIAEIEYKNGKKNGIKKFKRDTLLIYERYKDDRLIDTLCEFYETGFKRKCVPVINGKFDGEVLVYDKEGNPVSIEKYKNGVLISIEDINRFDRSNLPHGKWKFFYPNYLLRKEVDYNHGKLHGYVKYYDSTGRLMKIEKYLNDTLVSDASETRNFEVLRDYYSNGKIKVEAVYKNGIPDGIRFEYDSIGNNIKTYFFSNGELVYECKLDALGRKQGVFLEYAHGVLITKGFYKNDLKHGFWTYYDENGRIFQQGEYNNDKPIGKWITYYSNGSVQRIENYDDGSLNGEYIELSPDSQLIVKGYFVDDVPHGKWIYKIGDVYQEYSFNHGDLVGKQYIYDKDHKLPVSIENYRFGKQEGRQFYFDEAGKLKLDASYREGISHGIWIYYDNQGKRFLRIIYKDGEEIYIDNLKLP